MPKHEDTVANHDLLDFGARLKFIREYNGLSQRELAKRAGVPHSSISMIEQGLNSPSINSLTKILAGIPMSIAHFFSCDITQLQDHIFRLAELEANQKQISDRVCVQSIPLHHPSTQVRFEKAFYAAGSDTGDVPQQSAQGFSGLILRGAIELTINSEVSVLTAGDAFSLGALQSYRLRNLSHNEVCEIALCYV